MGQADIPKLRVCA